LQIGVAGAVLATVAGQAISAGMSMYFFFFRRNRTYQLQAACFKPDKSIIGEVLMIGLPSFLKSISTSLIVIVTNNLLRRIGGDSALGIFAIIGRLFTALKMPQTGIMQGMQPIVGYNFGQKGFDRARKTISLSLWAVIVYGLVVCSLCLLFPTNLIDILSKEITIITEGQNALRLLALSYPTGGVAILVAAYFQSVGKAKEALTITLGGILLVKLPVLLLASRLFALNGIWAAEAISELILCVASLFMLKSYQKKMIDMELLAFSPLVE